MCSAVEKVFAAVNGAPAYACLAGAHGIIEARRSPELAKAYREAELVLPDGMPTVWIGHSQGHATMDRVFGPDLMLQVFDRSQRTKHRHFLCGGKPGVAEELSQALLARFPDAEIVGTYTPPFRQLTAAELEELRETIARCKPDFFWVGLSTPKQEIFMLQQHRLLGTKVMIGVGAAFDYHTGRITDSPQWVKRAGLQWLHRLVQEPRRLLWRYVRTNTIFLTLWLSSWLRSQWAGSPRAEIAADSALERPVAD
jgi:N-acetylglucosaminyldiphosphoundecaprenol N-acetyl-beta-D-mannosaminyltransferase